MRAAPTAAELALKLDKATHWIEVVKTAIDTSDLTNYDLVCLQCELEEAVTMIEAKRKDKRAKLGRVNAVSVERPQSVNLDELLAELITIAMFINNLPRNRSTWTNYLQNRPKSAIPLEADLLLKRVKDGGHSGLFLANAFISAYRTQEPFNHSLGELTRLDAEGFRR